MKNRERMKLYMVIGLLVVFVTVGYFRFFHGKTTFFSRQGSGVASPATIDVPAVDLKGVQPAGLSQKTAFEVPRAGLRDIFAPVRKTASRPGSRILSAADAGAPFKPLPPLKLAGTIIGGKQPLAVINGRFLRRGEMLEGFMVVSIVKNEVTLVGGGRKVLLNTMTGAEERSP